MVHISDGVLDPWLWESGWVITIVILVYALSKMKTEDVPRLSVITAAVFVASLIHISIGPTSVHFILNGFAGVMLGILAFPCIFVALVLQCYLIFKTGTKLDIRPETKSKVSLFGAIAGGVAVVLALVFLAAELITTGEEFYETTVLVVGTHVPIIVIEAIFTGVLAGFVATVEPGLFGKK
jgi:cobalt/nickel transport system permease protein